MCSVDIHPINENGTENHIIAQLPPFGQEFLYFCPNDNKVSCETAFGHLAEGKMYISLIDKGLQKTAGVVDGEDREGIESSIQNDGGFQAGDDAVWGEVLKTEG